MQCPVWPSTLFKSSTLAFGGSRPKHWTLELCLGRVSSAIGSQKEHGAATVRSRYRSWRQRTFLESSGKQFLLAPVITLYNLTLGGRTPKFAHKNCPKRLRTRDLTSSQVLSLEPRPYDGTRAREPTSPWVSRHTSW